MSDNLDRSLKQTAVFSLLAVVLAQHVILYVAARCFATAVAVAGLSLALPAPTAMLVQRPWMLMLTASGIAAWSLCVGAKRDITHTHVKTHIVAMASIAIFIQLFGIVVFLMPFTGTLISVSE